MNGETKLKKIFQASKNKVMAAEEQLVESLLLYIDSSRISDADFVILVKFVLEKSGVSCSQLVSCMSNLRYSEADIYSWQQDKGNLPQTLERPNILRDFFLLLRTGLLTSQIALDFGFEDDGCRLSISPEILLTDCIDFDNRAAIILQQNGLIFVGQLLVSTREQLLKFDNLGPKTVDWIENFLSIRGDSLHMNKQSLEVWQLLSLNEVSQLISMSQRQEARGILKLYGISVVEIIAGKAKGASGKLVLCSPDLKVFIKMCREHLFINDNKKLVTDMYIPQPFVDYCKKLCS
jgi:hypothetical protein